MQDKRGYIERKISVLKHQCLWYVFSKNYDLILVSEYPKSGGTWYCQMLADYLALPYPRNQIPKFEKSILHSHYPYHKSFNKPVCVLRDGRDVMVSYYHHMYFGNDVLPPWVFEYYRTRAPFSDFENIEKNMPAYIEYMFTKHKMMGKIITWSSFIQSYFDKPDVLMIKYEDLLANPFETVGNTITKITGVIPNQEKLQATIQKFSFKNITQRKPGEENKKDFLRKGIAGDWKNYFNKEACKKFDNYAGKELVLLGYEKDRSWF